MASDIRRFAGPVVAVCWLALLPVPALAKPRTLIGTVTYRERIALPPAAVVEVSLLDISLADAPSQTIARSVLKPRRQVPLRYRLRFDDAKLKSGRTYALQARITVDGRLWFINTTRHVVFAGDANETAITVQRVDAAPSSGQ